MCRLVPFWLAAAKDVQATPAAVLTLRDPSAVANSLRLRNGMGRATAHALWLDHVLAAEGATRAIRRHLVGFDALQADPVRIAEQVAASLGLRLPAGDSWRSQVRAFIDSGQAARGKWLRPLERPSAARRTARDIYKRMQAVADGRLDETVSSRLDIVATERRKSTAQCAPRLPDMAVDIRAGLTG